MKKLFRVILLIIAVVLLVYAGAIALAPQGASLASASGFWGATAAKAFAAVGITGLSASAAAWILFGVAIAAFIIADYVIGDGEVTEKVFEVVSKVTKKVTAGVIGAAKTALRAASEGLGVPRLLVVAALLGGGWLLLNSSRSRVDETMQESSHDTVNTWQEDESLPRGDFGGAEFGAAES